MTYRTTVTRNREGRWQGCASPFTVAVRSYVIAIGVDPSLCLSKKGVTKDNLRDLTNFYSRVRFSHSRCDFIYYRRREDEKGDSVWKWRKKRIGVSRSTNALETKYSSLHSCAKEWKDSVAQRLHSDSFLDFLVVDRTIIAYILFWRGSRYWFNDNSASSNSVSLYFMRKKWFRRRLYVFLVIIFFFIIKPVY